jgi:hypothetical protein
MSDLKTRKNEGDVRAFIASVENDRRRADAFTLLDLMQDALGEAPALWGDSIIGFGSYHYQYDSGREGDMPLVGFSPRKQNLAVYIMAGFDQYDELLDKLGKHKTGKACLYINKLADVDQDVLIELVKRSAKHMARTNAE